MAESAVSSVLGRLGNLAIQETSLLCKVSGEVGFLKNELERLQGFLHDADSKRRSGDKSIAVWVRQIRDAAYDAENVIEVAEHVKKRNRLKKAFTGAISRYARLPSDFVTLHKVDAEIRRIRRNIQEIRDSASTLGILNLGGSTVPEVHRDVPALGDDDDVVVGFQKEDKQIVEELKNMENKQLTVISIVATGGAGKTTLARKLYDSAAVRGYFNAFAFVPVSQKFEVLRVLKDITMQAMGIKREDKEFGKMGIPEELEKMGVEEITDKLRDLLKEKRYLIVLDDVWTTDTWDRIKQAFPDINNGSRVLLTTRNLQAANQANKLTHVHQLKLLNEEESWQLFCSKAFPSYESIDTNLRSELEIVGESLVQKCHGLPLALVVLGGDLAKKLDRKEWLKMDDCLDWEVTRRGDIMQRIIARSYDDMSDHHLKSCFLFVASFPEDFDIQADYLIKAWIAEGFVQHKGRNTIEETARDYLEELARRSMVQVIVRDYYGRIRRLQMHDILHEWAVQEAQKEGFFKVCKNHGDLHVTSSETMTAYRISLVDFFHDEIGRSASNLRTMLGFSLPSVTLETLIYLRVLFVDNSNLEKFSKQLSSLIHLRYIGLIRCRNLVLPSSIGRLLNLQSIDLRGTPVPYIPKSLWDIDTLRHVEIPFIEETSTIPVPVPEQQKELQTLRIGRKSPTLWTLNNDVLIRMRKSLLQMTQLKVLQLRRLCVPADILACLSNHRYLVELELYLFMDKTGFPDSSVFPQNLRSLFLFVVRNCPVDPVPILGKLHNLVRVVLAVEEYEAPNMSSPAGGFPQLQSLDLWYIPVEKLRFEAGTMPKLTKLTLFKCGNMTRLPDGLLDLPSLKKLVLGNMENMLPEESHEELKKKGCKLIRKKKSRSKREPQFTHDNRCTCAETVGCFALVCNHRRVWTTCARQLRNIPPILFPGFVRMHAYMAYVSVWYFPLFALLLKLPC